MNERPSEPKFEYKPVATLERFPNLRELMNTARDAAVRYRDQHYPDTSMPIAPIEDFASTLVQAIVKDLSLGNMGRITALELLESTFPIDETDDNIIHRFRFRCLTSSSKRNQFSLTARFSLITVKRGKDRDNLVTTLMPHWYVISDSAEEQVKGKIHRSPQK